MEYKVPEEVLSKIPQHFWPAFAGELVSVFGLFVFKKDPDEHMGLDFLGGTSGWNAALRTTCKKLNMKWLFDYYDKLEWWQSDMFDGEFEDLLIKKFVEAKDLSASTYYAWLIGDDK